jgi:hypothetical protein
MVTTFAKKRAVSIFASVLTMLVVAAPLLRAQWTEVAPNLVQPEQQRVGALNFGHGVAWAGTQSLCFSLDTGKNWQKSSFTSFSGITDISIFDSLHVLVGTQSDGVFLSEDAGLTWNNVLPSNGVTYDRVSFNGSASIMHVLEYEESTLFTSTDAGVSWNSENIPGVGFNGINEGLTFAIGSDKTIYVFSSGGWINSSSDLGVTWSGNRGGTGSDSQGLAVDSCDVNKLYLVNENTKNRTNNTTEINVSPNGGSTWQTVATHRLDYYSGSIANTAQVIYVATVQDGGDGVERSTDFGRTWQNISGPTEYFDTRSLAAVNNNIVLMLDDQGSVWRTMNKGGDATLFVADTISCDSITRSVAFIGNGCSSQSPPTIAIIGANAASFKVTHVSNDSVSVTLYGVTDGEQHAELVLTLDNGSSDTILLAGYVKTSANVLSFSTENVHTDTLGGTVSVPIAINGLIHSENVELVLNYAGTLDYLGSFSPAGVKLDIPGEQWAGRSELQVNGALSGVIVGYAKFNVFNDSSAIANATFDSLTILTPITSCEYALPDPVIDTITTISGCGITMLSKWLYLGQEPTFSIWPNPAAGNVWISSSDDLGDVAITIYDMLGTQRSEIMTSIQKGNPVELMLPDGDGVYNILLKSAAGMNSLRVIRHK